MATFEEQLNNLLERTHSIKSPINAAAIGTDINEYNRPSEVWINDVEIFYNNYLKEHPLGDRMKTILFHRNLDAYKNLVGCLESISKDQDFINKMNGISMVSVPKYQAKTLPEFDVFISHANKDKEDLIEELYQSLNKLGIKIFYDKESLEWGDNWKDRILNGTKKAEFAIIVISENFFDREWTERELNEFLNRQNRNGQKLILPILHNITVSQLQEKYPSIADIQAIDSSKYSCDQIALLFARTWMRKNMQKMLQNELLHTARSFFITHQFFPKKNIRNFFLKDWKRIMVTLFVRQVTLIVILQLTVRCSLSF